MENKSQSRIEKKQAKSLSGYTHLNEETKKLINQEKQFLTNFFIKYKSRVPKVGWESSEEYNLLEENPILYFEKKIGEYESKGSKNATKEWEERFLDWKKILEELKKFENIDEVELDKEKEEREREEELQNFINRELKNLSDDELKEFIKNLST